MSFTISINGHDVPAEKVKEAFAGAVRALREANPDQTVGGSVSGYESGEPFSMQASEVGEDAGATEAGADAPGEDDPNVLFAHVTTED